MAENKLTSHSNVSCLLFQSHPGVETLQTKIWAASNRWSGEKNELNDPPKRPTWLEQFFNTAIKLLTLTRVISAAVRLDIEHCNFTYQIKFLSISTEDADWKRIKRFLRHISLLWKCLLEMLANYEFLFMNILHEMMWIRQCQWFMPKFVKYHMRSVEMSMIRKR